jgi:hypothetical protein
VDRSEVHDRRAEFAHAPSAQRPVWQ